MRSQKGIGLVAALAIGGGVVALGGLGYAVKKTGDRIGAVSDNAVRAVDARMGEFVRAIPGERYNQLIDDLYGEDQGKKERAQAFLTRLAGLKLDANYQVSAAFGFDEKPAVRAQLFPSASASMEAVELYFSGNENLVPVRSTILAAPSAKDRRDAMIAATKQLLSQHDTLRGKVWYCPDHPNYRAPTPAQRRGNPYSGMFLNCRHPAHRKMSEDSIANYENLFSTIVDAQLAAYHSGAAPTPLPSEQLTVAWNQLRDQYVILAVLESDLEKHKNDKCASDGTIDLKGKGCIRIWVHEKGDPKKVAYDGGVFNVSVLDFYRNPAIPNVAPDGSPVRFVARRADPAKMFDAEALLAYRQVQQLRKDQAKALGSAAAKK